MQHLGRASYCQSKSYIFVMDLMVRMGETAAFYDAFGTDSEVICLASSHFGRSHPTINCCKSPSVVQHRIWLQFSTLRDRNFTRSTQERIVSSSLTCALLPDSKSQWRYVTRLHPQKKWAIESEYPCRFRIFQQRIQQLPQKMFK